MRNLLNRELVWNKYGIGTGKYGIDFIDFEGNEVVLDVGSGIGNDVVIISQQLNRGGKIFAVDISQALLNVTRQRVCNIITPTLCAIASIEDLPFHTGQFDVIVAKHIYIFQVLPVWAPFLLFQMKFFLIFYLLRSQ